MKYKIIFILVIFLAFLLATQASGKEGQLGISKPVCREDFISAGVYNESLGIYSMICVAKVSPEYSCQKWQILVGERTMCLKEMF